jgi:mono/diheme cytochrome c family protein
VARSIASALSIIGIAWGIWGVGIAALPSPAAGDGLSSPARPEAENYVLHCSGCHRLDGSGIPGFAPDLREIDPLLDSTEGRRYLGRVPGVAQAPLDDAELAALLNWVLVEIAERRPDPGYRAEEVASLRAQPLRDPIAARRALSQAGL